MYYSSFFAQPKVPQTPLSPPATPAHHVQVIECVAATVQRRSFAPTDALESLKVVEIIERIYALR